MSRFALRSRTTGRAPEDDSQESSFEHGRRLGNVRTLRSSEKILETSLSVKELTDRVTLAADRTQFVQDTSAPPPLSDEEDAFDSDDRARMVASLLLRKDTLDFFERVFSSDDAATQTNRLGQFLMTSHDALYTFCRLVTEGGLTVAGGRLHTTALTDRILKALPDAK